MSNIKESSKSESNFPRKFSVDEIERLKIAHQRGEQFLIDYNQAIQGIIARAIELNNNNNKK